MAAASACPLIKSGFDHSPREKPLILISFCMAGNTQAFLTEEYIHQMEQDVVFYTSH
jgi:hypothetical protein